MSTGKLKWIALATLAGAALLGLSAYEVPQVTVSEQGQYRGKTDARPGKAASSGRPRGLGEALKERSRSQNSTTASSEEIVADDTRDAGAAWRLARRAVAHRSCCGRRHCRCGSEPLAAVPRRTRPSARSRRPLNNAPVWRAVRSGEHFTSRAAPGRCADPERGAHLAPASQRRSRSTAAGCSFSCLRPSCCSGWSRGTMKLRGRRPVARCCASRLERFIALGHGDQLPARRHPAGDPVRQACCCRSSAMAGWACCSSAGKLVPTYVGPLFRGLRGLMFLPSLRDNVWRPIDAQWIRRAGGLLDGATCLRGASTSAEDLVLVRRHLPRFHRGVSGLIMDFPNLGDWAVPTCRPRTSCMRSAPS